MSVVQVLVVFVTAALAYRFIVYPAFVSPLARIPNAHFSASVSPIWILWKRWSFAENRAIHRAHERYGPVVRLGPNELSVNCVDNGIRTIYAGGYEKHQWYPNLFHNYGVPNMFSMANSVQHSQRKRMLSNVYAKSTIQRSQDFASACQTIVARLHECLNVQNVDLYQLFNYTTMDIVTAYMFGISSSTTFLTDHDTAERWLRLYSSRKKLTFWPQELPSLTNALARIGIRLSPQWVADANHKLEESCLEMCRAAAKEDQANTPYQQLAKSLAVDKRTGPDPNPELVIASENLDHLSAGHETSAITLTYVFYELCRDQALQHALRQELAALAGLDKSAPSLPSAKQLDSLPLLHTVLLETLRLHPAIPGPQPRVTPEPRDSRGNILGQFHSIPGGVRVSSSPYSLHRLASVFPDPEAFRPQRWQTPSDDMHRHFWPFSSGGRMCIGSHLAMQQMKLVIAVLVANYTFGSESPNFGIIDEGPGGIGQEDVYTAPPRGGKLVVEVAKARA